MKIRKFLSVISVMVMSAAVMAGCGNSSSGSSTVKVTDAVNETTTKQVTENGTDTAQETVQESDNKTGKILVAYYSATGSTEKVAQEIARETGADTFVITPVQPYTSDDLNWGNDDSRVSGEHNDESLRDVELTQVTPDNWESYDIVFIGYPIWWYIAAWPVNNFVSGNDFSGKTVIPFCTSASSGIGDSGNLLEEMAGTGNWQEGHRFSSRASESDINEWVSSLSLGN
ncbi:MAG: flavodoxin [Butyrivibrio sp.]